MGEEELRRRMLGTYFSFDGRRNVVPLIAAVVVVTVQGGTGTREHFVTRYGKVVRRP